MGYILPITHYSYINYGYRMQKNEKSPHAIESPFKVMLDGKKEDINEQGYNEHAKSGSHFDHAVKVKQSIKSELTGKGHRLNVEI